jgi:branched-chain amino acid transport system permease protein
VSGPASASPPPATHPGAGEQLSVADIRKAFGGIQALNGATLQTCPGITCIIGPNGAGKTSLFNAICGTFRIDSGVVQIGERNVSGSTKRRVARHGIARSFQDLRLFHSLTVLDNVLVGLPRQRGVNALSALVLPVWWRDQRRIARPRAMELLEQFGLSEVAQSYVDEIPQAHQRLLAIARVVATDARYLLLDEPLAGLDSASVDVVVAQLRRLVSAGHSILMVEHNFEAVRSLADSVVLMTLGDVIFQGDVAELLERRDLMDLYFD